METSYAFHWNKNPTTCFYGHIRDIGFVKTPTRNDGGGIVENPTKIAEVQKKNVRHSWKWGWLQTPQGDSVANAS